MRLWPVVGVVAVLQHKLIIEVNVEYAVSRRHQLKAIDVVAVVR